MDPRRVLILALSSALLSGCAILRDAVAPSAAPAASLSQASSLPLGPIALDGPAPTTADDPEPEPEPEPAAASALEADAARPYLAETPSRPAADATPAAPALTGRRAIAEANSAASAPSRSDRFQGGVQIFAWEPGRVFEVWTAPLRVTTLTLGAGETLIAKAAGDTVRWQIGEVASGEGPDRRVHVLIKPLERGLETNLVLTTNQRVYLVDLRSGAADAFNAAVAWDSAPTGVVEAGPAAVALQPAMRVPDAVVMPEGPLDARYRLEPQGRRPRWTPSAVFHDGRRTFIAFPADLQVDEAPALFAIAPDGEAQLVNYRQAGGLFIVDRVLDRAELRLGDRRPQVVRIRHQGARP
ncbi:MULTISPECIES: TrbG/VirB9 family P-type conjugative transfer protein [Brevundimonas]|jgi:type IV secretion system protein TrbG|uniref:TrbG/VirB9 family P-type conjugative transfer protein n=2 Tax=Caulobacteraceae TaxID=76892 RepID=UPI000C8C2A77|nr:MULTISPECIES: TrbG/VirB9 family P-type conjugative transfer protein [Brevundimonas]MAL55683.1 conjugal transfer protein TrbG [Brevundimonas sp.]MBJ7484884.1 TrbG/VirB9 family P-type conjugative transfer protein [Brevundimonas sp.]PZU72502.1 MAG: conjugal transfer protein TrbG [Brevundimonas sp.]